MTLRRTCAAIILAAGRSRRMGTQKLLLPLAGQTVVGHVVDQVLSGGADPVIVVVGHDAAAIGEALAGRRVTLVENPDHDAEMLSSVRCGLRALPTDCDAAMIVPADQPGLRAELVAALLAAFRDRTMGIVVPLHAGKRGHPVLISSRYFDEVLSSLDDVGLRGLLLAHADDILEVPTADPATLEDMDYPADYEREVSRREPPER